jgi:predicted nucleotide-binding protein (sugar kinase/HSP70/actin superfamily)
MIQLAPFTCIPEIVARTILPTVSRDYDIPVLTFFLDEQTGKAGMLTRLEAFTDLMRRKKFVQAGTNCLTG